jgi:hypothetical protein
VIGVLEQMTASAAVAIAAAAPAAGTTMSPIWDTLEPHYHEDAPPPVATYCKHLKADLLPGTFVILLAPDSTSAGSTSRTSSTGESRNPMQHTNGKVVVARIMDWDTTCSTTTTTTSPSSTTNSVFVNIFKPLKDLVATSEEDGFVLHPETIPESHLRYVPEIVQTDEQSVISRNDIINLAFVFTMESLYDSPTNLFYTCQGMTNAFVVRFRLEHTTTTAAPRQPMLRDIPDGYCRPFPSSYPQFSYYYDCLASRIWNSLICIKLQITKILGQDSYQQGLYATKDCRLSPFTAEAWGFLRLQFHNLFDNNNDDNYDDDDDDNNNTRGTIISRTRVRRHRITESGVVVKAARVVKSCTMLRFETKSHLQQLCHILGESTIAGQRCPLPKTTASSSSSSSKGLSTNDILNVVCGSDHPEPDFNAETTRDGIDLEFDGCSELCITIRYRRFVYTANSLFDAQCDPLLSSLIRRLDPYRKNQELVKTKEEEDANTTPAASIIIVQGSEFEDRDGCIYRVVDMDVSNNTVRAKCFYPLRNNPLVGMEKSFDIPLAKELIESRLDG